MGYINGGIFPVENQPHTTTCGDVIQSRMSHFQFLFMRRNVVIALDLFECGRCVSKVIETDGIRTAINRPAIRTF